MPERSCDGCKLQREWGCHAEPYLATDDDGELLLDDNGQTVVEWHDAAAMPIDLLGEVVWHCPRQHIKRNPAMWSVVLKYYGMYAKGHLPDRGAVSDQSNKAVEVFRIIDDANALCDKHFAEEAAKKRARETPNRR